MSLIIKLREAKNFTPNEVEAAKYIITHADEVIKLSCTELAKKTYTSPATIIRLCKKIGIGGYQEFKVILATEINFFIKNRIWIIQILIKSGFICSSLIQDGMADYIHCCFTISK